MIVVLQLNILCWGSNLFYEGQMLDEEPDIKSVDKAEKKAKSAKKKTKKAKKARVAKKERHLWRSFKIPSAHCREVITNPEGHH